MEQDEFFLLRNSSSDGSEVDNDFVGGYDFPVNEPEDAVDFECLTPTEIIAAQKKKKSPKSPNF